MNPIMSLNRRTSEWQVIGVEVFSFFVKFLLTQFPLPRFFLFFRFSSHHPQIYMKISTTKDRPVAIPYWCWAAIAMCAIVRVQNGYFGAAPNTIKRPFDVRAHWQWRKIQIQVCCVCRWPDNTIMFVKRFVNKPNWKRSKIKNDEIDIRFRRSLVLLVSKFKLFQCSCTTIP